jgi:hypothetical protein
VVNQDEWDAAVDQGGPDAARRARRNRSRAHR